MALSLFLGNVTAIETTATVTLEQVGEASASPSQRP